MAIVHVMADKDHGPLRSDERRCIYKEPFKESWHGDYSVIYHPESIAFGPGWVCSACGQSAHDQGAA